MGLDSPETQKRLEKFRKAPMDGQSLKRLVEAGLTWLRTNQQMVNALNVFPVPDGDTGTNMVLTMQSAYNEISELGHRSVDDMAAAVSQGALMGARGNSGVILSQLWRGFSRGLQGQEVLDGPGLVKAFAEARDTAYKGVVRPVEGTILTVAKDIAAATEAGLKPEHDAIDVLGDGGQSCGRIGRTDPGPAPGPQAGRCGRLGRQGTVLHPGRHVAPYLW